MDWIMALDASHVHRLAAGLGKFLPRNVRRLARHHHRRRHEGREGDAMTITYHPAMIQGSEEWIAARCGMLTASEMGRIITPSTLKPARNDKASSHLYELLAQRITGHVEPHYISDDMLRGQEDEIVARQLYAEHFAPVQDCGFVTNNEWGFTLGYSPDGLVGDDGLIECKSRRQKFQVETIISAEVPQEYRIQIQTALLVTDRQWCDFVSCCRFVSDRPAVV